MSVYISRNKEKIVHDNRLHSYKWWLSSNVYTSCVLEGIYPPKTKSNSMYEVIASHGIMWDAITYPCLRYLLLTPKSSCISSSLYITAVIVRGMPSWKRWWTAKPATSYIIHVIPFHLNVLYYSCDCVSFKGPRPANSIFPTPICKCVSENRIQIGLVVARSDNTESTAEAHKPYLNWTHKLCSVLFRN